MKQTKAIGLVITLLMPVMSGSVVAHGGHYRGYGNHFRSYGGYGFGFYSGFPWPYYFPFYPPYYAYPPPAVTMPGPPPVYIERNPVQTAPQPPANYWYYCRNPDGYYPYVRECPGGWQPVAPQPPWR